MHQPIEYPPFEAPLSTDLLTSVALTGTNHAEDQPVHLRVVPTRKYLNNLKNKTSNPAVGAGVSAVQTEADVEGASASGEVQQAVEDEKERRRNHVRVNLGEYAGLLGRACPAGVYEYVPEEGSPEVEKEGWNGHKLVINSQVCLSLQGQRCHGADMTHRTVYIANSAT